MEKQKIIIIGLIAAIAVILVGIGIYATGLMNSNTDNWQTIECNDTGTTFKAPKDVRLRTDTSVEEYRESLWSSADGDICIQRTNIDEFDVSGGASDLINSYNGQQAYGATIKAVSKSVRNNDTGESFLISSMKGDNETVNKIADSIVFGNKTMGAKANTTTNSASSSSDSSDKTFPDPYGKGSYHVGDVIDDHDNLLQLQPNGQWIKIGVAERDDQQDNHESDDDKVESSSSSSNDEDYDVYVDDRGRVSVGQWEDSDGDGDSEFDGILM